LPVCLILAGEPSAALAAKLTARLEEERGVHFDVPELDDEPVTPRFHTPSVGVDFQIAEPTVVVDLARGQRPSGGDVRRLR
jgi:hypothetical protein